MDKKEEELLEKALTILEHCGNRLVFGLSLKAAPERKWYTFSELSLRCLQALGVTSDNVAIRAICASLYGSIKLFGLKETARLVLKLVKAKREQEHVNASTKKP